MRRSEWKKAVLEINIISEAGHSNVNDANNIIGWLNLDRK
jgi:hypothetical protein